MRSFIEERRKEGVEEVRISPTGSWGRLKRRASARVMIPSPFIIFLPNRVYKVK